MARSILHLLLVLGLILNGVLAPWAPAHAHADHAAHAANEAPPAHTAMHDHAAMLAAADASAATEDGAGKGCCGGAICQCGCVLPPAVSATLQIAAVAQRAVAIDMASDTLATVLRSSPPFRPPAA